MTVRNLSALLVVVSVGLAGCADERMESAVAALGGQPVPQAFAKFGPPDQEQAVKGDKIYTWVVDEYGPTGFKPQLLIQYECRVRLTSDGQDIVRGTEWSGNRWGCNKLLARRG
jgi:hypothetical protein